MTRELFFFFWLKTRELSFVHTLWFSIVYQKKKDYYEEWRWYCPSHHYRCTINYLIKKKKKWRWYFCLLFGPHFGPSITVVNKPTALWLDLYCLWVYPSHFLTRAQPRHLLKNTSIKVAEDVTSTIFLQYFHNKLQVVSCYWFKFEHNPNIIFLSQQ